MSFSVRWMSAALIMSTPYLVLMGLGSLWLWEHQRVLIWVGLTGACSMVGWWWLAKLAQQRVRAIPGSFQYEEPQKRTWSAQEHAAWNAVEAIAARLPEQPPISLERPDAVQSLAHEVLGAVARQYAPSSKQPELEIPIPDLLRAVEVLSRDLRRTLRSYLPGSHILTINHLQGAGRMVGPAKDLYGLYRAVSFTFNPTAALARELNAAVTGQLMNSFSKELQTAILQYCIRRLGGYAIDLYSGRLALDEAREIADAASASATVTDVTDAPVSPAKTAGPGPGVGAAAVSEAEEAHAKQASLREEPFRVLVVGQVKAGKSSLINAIFGEVRAAVDVVPRTDRIEPYVLEHSGETQAIILDTVGYDDPGLAVKTSPFQGLEDQVARTDLVILVCSATQAARQADRALLDHLRALYRDHPDHALPPILIALTQVDRLRPFQEWNPPYNLRDAHNVKARNIKSAMEAVAADLDIDVDVIIPVCLAPGRLTNVEESFLPAMWTALDEDGQRHRLRRVLKQFRDDRFWSDLWSQTKNAGRVLGHLTKTAARGWRKRIGR